MINVKQAVKAAGEFLKELYDQNELIDLILEEVELTEDEKYWLVTFGFTRRLTEPISERVTRSDSGSPFNWIGVKEQSEHSQKYAVREYKIIQVDADTGEAMSMKIREL